MIPNKLRDFMSRLLSATEQEQLSWYEGADESYICDHKNHTLFIRSQFDDDREISFFTFRISTDGKVTPFTVTSEETDYLTMKTLYEAVIVNANNVEPDLEDFFT